MTDWQIDIYTVYVSTCVTYYNSGIVYTVYIVCIYACIVYSGGGYVCVVVYDCVRVVHNHHAVRYWLNNGGRWPKTDLIDDYMYVN